MKILFSPVGMTDPVSYSNYDEGSLLHISRMYKPEKIVLFFSKEIYELHKIDNRYVLSIETLYKSMNKNVEIEIIKDESLEEVQIFDNFYEIFRETLNDIHYKNPNDEILLNISSGTPAMKNALFVLSKLGNYKMKAIQVDTPTKAANRKFEDNDFDLDAVLEIIAEKSNENIVNRSREAASNNFNYEIKRELIFSQLDSYNYSSALQIARTIEEMLSEKTMNLLNAAYYRSILNIKSMVSFLRKADEDFFRIKGDGEDILEYFLYLKTLKNKEMFLDLIRGITPLVTELFILIIDKNADIKLKNYWKYNYGKKHYVWDEDKLNRDEKGREIVNAIKSKFPYFTYNSFIQNVHLIEIIKNERIIDNQKILDLSLEIRDVEGKLRNRAAHEIIRIDDSLIKRESKFGSDEILDKIFELMKLSGLEIGNNHYDSYDLMNKKIKKSFK
ncbi:type III-A CRISPR-associated CARF protein Csm6 [Peptoniphilus indolicus]|uniref:CRISPR type III-A/MTUBE-associated protein Csm6 n=1 Tax=Peptoniphilus indolicus TaxID=33030 RepID=A0A379DBW4_9FIRM|nr:hypothetical protein [Peptoniphilus indolicus]SUB75498.1 CRISPR type III-A/MTUBE-associated protein Csm6 [Peptoniphilus indolicus]